MSSVFSKLAAVVLAGALALPATAAPQKAAPRAAAKKAKAAQPEVTADDIRALREMMEKQQEQINLLREELARRNSENAQATEGARQAQAAAAEAAQKAASAEAATAQSSESTSKLQADLNDVKLNQQNAAISSQDDQKRWGALEGILGRFRFSGDVRVRYEDFFQDNPAPSTPFADRHRARIRLRFGVDGKLGEDFLGGFALATGDLNDPVSPNTTLGGSPNGNAPAASFFNRKQIGVDKAFITFAPGRYKWLQLTGGKWAYTWNRTPLTFDNDINPDGFSERVSFNVNNKFLKNVTAGAMQLMLLEQSGGSDTWASGAHVNAKLQLGSRVTVTPSYYLLKFHNENAILQNGYGLVVAPAVAPTPQYVANRQTNCTVNVAGKVTYCSGYAYSNASLEAVVKTWSDRVPLRLFGEYHSNLDAASSQGQAHSFDVSLGQAKNRNDVLVGYAFYRTERDALIAAFADSDFKAPTNLTQSKLYASWVIRPNLTFNYAGFFGRTLDVNIPGAFKPTGLPAGVQDPILKRMQFDFVYKF